MLQLSSLSHVTECRVVRFGGESRAGRSRAASRRASMSRRVAAAAAGEDAPPSAELSVQDRYRMRRLKELAAASGEEEETIVARRRRCR